MSLVVTLHAYSGRPNPSWVLSEENARELLERIESLEEQIPLKARALVGRLGYRGFSISSVPASTFGEVRLAVNDGIIDLGQTEMSFLDRTRGTETWLLETAAAQVSDTLRAHVLSTVEEVSAEEAIRARSQLFRPPDLQCTPRSADAPAFLPTPWNQFHVKPFNNCYNYANDRRTDTLAQPGLARGAVNAAFDCASVRAAAEADGLVAVPDFSGQRASGEGWYVALYVWPGEDYHWYRQDANGCWSHKPGKTSATSVDNVGRGINNPQTCARRPYTQFCTFMVTNRSVRIR